MRGESSSRHMRRDNLPRLAALPLVRDKSTHSRRKFPRTLLSAGAAMGLRSAVGSFVIGGEVLACLRFLPTASHRLRHPLPSTAPSLFLASPLQFLAFGWHRFADKSGIRCRKPITLVPRPISTFIQHLDKIPLAQHIRSTALPHHFARPTTALPSITMIVLVPI